MRTQISRAAAVAIAGLLVLTAGASANFGSNVNSADEVAHPCDTTKYSQCVANDGSHYIYDFGLTAGWHDGVDYAIVSVYNPVADVMATWTTSSSVADVYATDANYGLNNLWGWTECASSATYGGSDPDRWCKPQWIKFNTTYSHTASQKEAIACHEVGHTLGLRHSTEATSCMKSNQQTYKTLTTHDKNHLTGQY